MTHELKYDLMQELLFRRKVGFEPNIKKHLDKFNAYQDTRRRKLVFKSEESLNAFLKENTELTFTKV